MDKLKYVKLENEDGSYSSSIPLAVDSDYVDVNGTTLTVELANKANASDVNTSIANLASEISGLASGSPAGVYDTVAALTTADPDHDKIYVVSADGHWYYYNSGWQDGGAYQATAVDENDQTILRLSRLYEELNNHLGEEVNFNKNIFNKKCSSKFIDANDGTTTYKYLSYASSDDFMDIPVNTNIIVVKNIPTNMQTGFLLFYDSSNNYLGWRSTAINKYVNGVFTLENPYPTATKIKYEIQFTTSDAIHAKDMQVVEIYADYQVPSKTYVNKLVELFKADVPLTIDSWTQNYCYTLVTNALYSISSYKYTVIENTGYTKMKITAWSNANCPPIVFLKDSEVISTNVIGYNKCGMTSTNVPEKATNYEVEIPMNCTHILLQAFKNSGYDTQSYTYESLAKDDVKEEGFIRYNINNGILKTYTPFGSDNSTLMVEFGKRGPNQIADFRYIKVNDTSIYSNVTDWHSPLIVGAVSNIDGDHPDNHYFTGGNHSYNNTGEGVASGRTGLLKYFIDEVETSSGEGYCNHIRIEWINYVQGYNTEKEDGTGREIIKEIHRMDFDGHQWTSEAHYIPLENISFERLYGFQCSGTHNQFPNIRYIGGANRGLYQGNQGNNCGNKTCSKFVAYGDLFQLEMEVDTSIDLGDRHLLSTNDACFNNSYGKAYFNFLSTITANAGDDYAIRGYYRFLPHVNESNN